MSGYSLRTIAERLEGELFGDPDVKIQRVRTPQEAGLGDISVVLDQRSASSIHGTRASAMIVPFEADSPAPNVIRVKDPRQALVRVLELFYPENHRQPGIDRRAIISPQAQVDPTASVAAGAYIEQNAVIGARVVIYPNVYVGEGVRIGEDSIIFPNVTLYAGTQVGKRVRVHSGAVIGSDGFGYIPTESGVYRKIPQVGCVEIEDDVEIGANSTVDRATLGTTRIGSGTKIDNLVQVGHNSEIGRNCCIVAQVGISGSVRIGDSALLAGQVGISDHITVGQGVKVGAQSGVRRDLPSGEWIGSPAIPAEQARRALVLVARLPEFRKEIRELQKRCAQLEELVKPLQNSLSGKIDGEPE